MGDNDGPPDLFAAEVQALGRLGDDELLAAWAENDRRLEARRVTGRHELRLRHYVFRAAAVERFGAEGHVERRRAAARVARA
jgi:hypothetical protein